MENWTLTHFKTSRATLVEYIQYLDIVQEKMSGSEFAGEKLVKNDERYYSIELDNWNKEAKELLFLETARGIYYFVNFHSKKKSFPISGYNNLKSAIQGQESIQIYKKGVANYTDRLISILVRKNVILGRPRRDKTSYYESNSSNNWLEDASGTNDPETMNNVYWNLD